MTAPVWETCAFCGEKRDRSGRYTSPANQAKDAQWWAEAHLSAKCRAPIFASKTGRDLNRDPEPWLRMHRDLGFMGRFEARFAGDDEHGYQMRFVPRPMFDHVQHNAPNPLMKDVRAFLAGLSGEDFRQECLSLLEAMDEIAYDDPSHVTHVRRVLTRLAAVSRTRPHMSLAVTPAA